jgi:hypothetical protein
MDKQRATFFIADGFDLDLESTWLNVVEDAKPASPQLPFREIVRA